MRRGQLRLGRNLAHNSILESPAINGRLVKQPVFFGRHEIKPPGIVHRGYAVHILGINVLDLSLKGKRGIVNPRRPEHVLFFPGGFIIVKEKIFPVAGNERLHRIARIAPDRDGFIVPPFGIFRRIGQGGVFASAGIFIEPVKNIVKQGVRFSQLPRIAQRFDLRDFRHDLGDRTASAGMLF